MNFSEPSRSWTTASWHEPFQIRSHHPQIPGGSGASPSDPSRRFSHTGCRSVATSHQHFRASALWIVPESHEHPLSVLTYVARRLFADRGYDYDKYRRLVWKRGIKPMIARRGVAHGSGLGKVRWVVERAFAWLHQFKRLRTRYERRAGLHQGLLDLACSIICLRRLRKSF